MLTERPPPLPLRIVTHNIRYATTSPFENEKPWSQRVAYILSNIHFLIRQAPASLICLQEVLNNQRLDILYSLTSTCSPHWKCVGVGRNNGREAGEFSPIFYRDDVWRKEYFETFWLCPTPNKPGKGWDAASIRIVSVLVLEHQESGRRVLAMNTHLDDQGEVSRRMSAQLILKIAAATANRFNVDFSFLAGDLNSEVSGEAYQIFNAPDSMFVDMSTVLGQNEDSNVARYGNIMTFTGFKDKKMKRIDFIHLGKSGAEWPDAHGRASKTAVFVEGYAVVPNKFDNGIYMSDHRAVVGDLVIT